MGFLIAGVLLVAGALAVAISVRWPKGQGPYDVLPQPWQNIKAVGSDRVNASSGRIYEVESWPVRGNATFHVARLVPGLKDYVTYTQDRATGLRKLFRSFVADDDDDQADARLAQMAADFGLS